MKKYSLYGKVKFNFEIEEIEASSPEEALEKGKELILDMYHLDLTGDPYRYGKLNLQIDLYDE